MIIKKYVMIFCCFLTIFSTTLWAKPVTITLLATSDVHGRMVPWNYYTDQADFSGSYAQIASLLKQYRAQNNPLLVLEVGDIIQDNFMEQFINASPHPAMLALNTMRYDILVPGNHEFNFGVPALNKVLNQFNGQVLSANIFIKESGKPYQLPNIIIEKAGVKIGFIGVTTPFVPEYEAKSGYVNELIFTPPIAEIKKQVAALQQAGVDAIVVIAHMGLDNENDRAGTGVADIAAQVDGIDVIVAGHNHQNISEKVINNVVITEPHRYGTMVSVITLNFDREGNAVKLISKNAQTVSVNDQPADPAIEQIYQPYHTLLREQANQVIGNAKQALVTQEKIKGISRVYMRDSGLASLFNDAQQYYSKADVTTILFDREVKLAQGPIKRKDIAYNYQYTGGEISVYEVTGKDLKDYMEWSAGYFAQVVPGDQAYRFDEARAKAKYRTYDIFGGVTYTIDLREPVGQRIKDLRLADGTAIRDQQKIKLGATAYRYEMLVKPGGPLEGRRVSPIWDSKTAFGEEQGTIRNLVIDYIKQVKQGEIDGQSHDRWQVVGL